MFVTGKPQKFYTKNSGLLRHKKKKLVRRLLF
jgi:hypothetical protein